MTVENSRRRSRKEQKKRNGKDIMYLKTKKLWGKKGDNRFSGTLPLHETTRHCITFGTLKTILQEVTCTQPRLLPKVTAQGSRVNHNRPLLKLFTRNGLINNFRVEWGWRSSYLQMSWLEGETDILEKLHGALTEVGLPACGTKHRQKYNDRNNYYLIQQTGSNHISCVARIVSRLLRIIRLSVPEPDLHTKSEGVIQRMKTNWKPNSGNSR